MDILFRAWFKEEEIWVYNLKKYACLMMGKDIDKQKGMFLFLKIISLNVSKLDLSCNFDISAWG